MLHSKRDRCKRTIKINNNKKNLEKGTIPKKNHKTNQKATYYTTRNQKIDQKRNNSTFVTPHKKEPCQKARTQKRNHNEKGTWSSYMA